MSRSVDPGHFFQTSDSLATSARKTAKSNNKSGNPIALPSKILAVEADVLNPGIVYVAEAAGTARRIVLETGNVSATYTGANAPLTCLALSTPTSHTPTPRILFAGCWDKSIHSWDLETRKPLRRYLGHADFVKCVLAASVSGTQVLISGSADATIIVWDVASGKRLHTLKGHARGILDLAIDPAASGPEEIVLFSADSVRDIRRWKISLAAAGEVAQEPIRAHQTSVNRLRFEDVVAGDADADTDADLWTASSDNTAQHLVRARDWAADTTLQHPDFVRDVVVDQDAGLVVTACRDEGVRVWKSSSGDLVCVFDGHFDEVTGLVLMPGAEGQKANRVVSVGIDRTVRTWSLDAAEMQKAREEAERRAQGVEEPQAEEVKESMLTAEEEAELAELMDSDDE